LQELEAAQLKELASKHASSVAAAAQDKSNEVFPSFLFLYFYLIYY